MIIPPYKTATKGCQERNRMFHISRSLPTGSHSSSWETKCHAALWCCDANPTFPNTFNQEDTTSPCYRHRKKCPVQLSTRDPTSASLTLSQCGYGHISGALGFAGHNGDTDKEKEVRRKPRVLPQSSLLCIYSWASDDKAKSGFKSEEKCMVPSSLKMPVFSCV